MLHIKLIAPGTLKEAYLRDALAEYKKRLSAFARVEIVELKEHRLPDDPAPAEIAAALEREADLILAAVPPRAYLTALCVEGKQFSSEELSDRLARVMQEAGTLCLVIGSSHGLSPRVKQAADLCLSVSKLTFPHQLMRVLLLEAVYRAFNIRKGTRYHK